MLGWKLKFLADNIFLVGLVLGSGAMLVWSLLVGSVRGAKTISATQSVQLINREHALVLDVRDAAEYAAGHIAEAMHIPLSQLEISVEKLMQYKEKPLIVQCQSGTRSAKACAILSKHGFTQLYQMEGGLLSWEQAKLPVSRA